jgi:vacuolar-type H+-ATPase subunit I/STV1
MNGLLDGIEQVDTPELDPNKSYSEELLAKYGDVEGLAKSKVHADVHIKTLETRMDQLRDEYERVLEQSKAAPKFQELLDRLEKIEKPLQVERTPVSNEDNRTVLDPERVESLISSRIEQHEQSKRQSENFATVDRKARELLGDNYKAVLKQRADSLGLRNEDVDSMARTNPNLFFKTFDISEQSSRESFKAPPTSQVRQSNFAGQGEQKRTMTYYENLRKTNPKLYFDPKIAVQMDKDAQSMGAAFFDLK